MAKDLSNLCLDIPINNIDFSVQFSLKNSLLFGIGDNPAVAHHFSFHKGWKSEKARNNVLVITAHFSEFISETITLSTEIPLDEGYASIGEFLEHLWDGYVLYPTHINLSSGSNNKHFTITLDIGHHNIQKIRRSKSGMTFYDMSHSYFLRDTYRPAIFNAQDHEDFINFDSFEFSSQVEPIISVNTESGEVLFGSSDYVDTFNDHTFTENSNYWYVPGTMDSSYGVKIKRHSRHICFDGFTYDMRNSWRKLSDIRRQGLALFLQDALEQELIRNGHWKEPNLFSRNVSQFIAKNIDKFIKDSSLNEDIIF